MDLWRKERIQSVLYKAVKQEDVEMAAKCLKMGAVDVNTRYEPVRSFITRNSNVGVHLRMSKYVCLFYSVLLPILKNSNEYQYLKCTAISLLILNVEKYWGNISIPSRYWSIFQYQYWYFFLKYILLGPLENRN